MCIHSIDTFFEVSTKAGSHGSALVLVLLFLDSCGVTKWLKAASILDRYLKNAKKVVPQNIHLFLDL